LTSLSAALASFLYTPIQLQCQACRLWCSTMHVSTRSSPLPICGVSYCSSRLSQASSLMHFTRSKRETAHHSHSRLTTSRGGVDVSFVQSKRSNTVEKAHLQLWIPKAIRGDRLVSPSQASGSVAHSRQARPFSFASSSANDSRPHSFINGAGAESPILSRTNSVASPFQSSPSSSHVERTLGFSSQSQSSPTLRHTNSVSSPSQSFQPWSHTNGVSPPSQSFVSPSQVERMNSASSTVTSAPSSHRSFTSVGTNSSRNSDTTITALSTGKGTGLGYMHSKPLKPMLVLFTRSNDEAGKLSFVTIQIDDQTSVNPERCDCRKSARSCTITAIERSQGSSFLLAGRYEAEHGTRDWNVIHIGAITQQGPRHNEWKDIQRVSIRFSSPDGMYLFVTSQALCVTAETLFLFRSYQVRWHNLQLQDLHCQGCQGMYQSGPPGALW
jgi:hypothetical protein